MREHRLRVYRIDPDEVEPIPDTHHHQNQDTDSEIGSVIVVGGEDDDEIDSDKSDDNSNYEDEPGDYPIPLSMEEQANNEVSSDSSPAATPDLSSELEPASIEPEPSPEPVSSASSSSRAETPSSTFSEASQSSERRSRAGRALISSEQANLNRQ
jgi:hypothetical protein